MNTRTTITREDCEFVLKQGVDTLSPLKNSTVVITGGTGFMGTWLTELMTYLNDKHGFGIQIHLLAKHTERFKSEKPHLSGRNDVSLIKANVRHIDELPKNTNWIIHAAANPDNRFHTSDPLETMGVITQGTESILRAADRCSDLKMLLNISSGLVYGEQPWEVERFSEKNAIVSPHGQFAGWASPYYAEAKIYAEMLCHAAASQIRLPSATIRPFLFVGPYRGLDSRSAIYSFIADALVGKPIRILGDGQTVRSYMHGADMAFWILRILTGAKPGETYNMGSPEGVNLVTLADMVASQVSRRPEVRLKASLVPINERSRFVPDVDLAAKKLGLKLQFDLKYSIGRTIAWYEAAEAKIQPSPAQFQ